MRTGGFEFAAKALDVHVDDIRKRFVALVPHVLGDIRSADHRIRAAGEMFEEGILARRKRKHLYADAHAPRANVEGQIADDELIGGGRLAPRRMSARSRASNSRKSKGLVR